MRSGPNWLAAAALLVSAAQASRPAPLLLNFVSAVDGTQQSYVLYVPPGYDAKKAYPLVVSLHSEESTHRLNYRQLFAAPAGFSRVDPLDPRFYPAARDVDFLVAFPFARGSIGYRGIAEADVYEMLADVEKRYLVDRDRVYLTGISMGGGGALWYALTRPDIWAGVAPLAPGAPPGMEALAGNAFDLPVRLFQGEQDPIIPVQSARDWHRRFEDAGVAAHYFEFPSVRHDIWNAAYKNGAIFDWFATLKRNAAPDRVKFATDAYRYASAYWVRIDRLMPGTVATIDARRTSGTEIRVTTKNLDGFSLTPDGPASVVNIDGAAVRVKPGAALSFQRVSGQWKLGRAPAEAKRAGAEGPIAAAFGGGQIYVYGDGSAVAADHAAQWGPLSFRVLADSNVTPADMADSDAILFGTAQTNAIIAKLAAQLPLELNPGAADYGLLFIAPAGQHYVVVSSGLPWWTGAAEANRGGDRFAPEAYRLLSTFGDYVLFKGSLAHVVAEGRFDSSWKAPPDAAIKLRASGVVTVR